MYKMLKLSWLNVKNTIGSRKLLLGIIAAFAYSMLWIVFVQPKHYGLVEYDFEFGRFLYLMILYASVSILRNDIKFNTSKTLFTGIFTRTQVMLSKGIGLIMLGIVFGVVVELNNILAALILHNKIGLTGFLVLNHAELFVANIAITFTMGSLMILIASLMFNGNKAILFFIVFLSMINFYTAGISTLAKLHPEVVHNVFVYMKTPFYITEDLMQGNFSFESIVIYMLWAAAFYAGSIIVINKREI